MRLVMTEAIREKIWNEHHVSEWEVNEAWNNGHSGPWFIDDRERHKTNPPTVWTLSTTDLGRLLKLVVIPHKVKGIAILRTSYEPDDDEVSLYENNI